MKASQQAIERGVKDCLFVDYKRRSGHFDVTTVASIKEITEKNRHCLLDIAPHAIERLHHMHIYPIVIFIRYKSAKHIKWVSGPVGFLLGGSYAGTIALPSDPRLVCRGSVSQA